MKDRVIAAVQLALTNLEGFDVDDTEVMEVKQLLNNLLVRLRA